VWGPDKGVENVGNFLLWAFGKHIQKVCKIMESTIFVNVMSEYCISQ